MMKMRLLTSGNRPPNRRNDGKFSTIFCWELMGAPVKIINHHSFPHALSQLLPIPRGMRQTAQGTQARLWVPQLPYGKGGQGL